jgi:predicted  nucleic acid-binding Zn-ribbon protein
MRREVGMDQENLAPLIEFIGKKFDQVDQRFEAMDTKIADARRHIGVLVEAVRDDVRQVAEGVSGVTQRLDTMDQRLERFEQKVEAEFAETRAAVRFSYVQIERRIQELEGNYAALNERVGRLEARTA